MDEPLAQVQCRVVTDVLEGPANLKEGCAILLMQTFRDDHV